MANGYGWRQNQQGPAPVLPWQMGQDPRQQMANPWAAQTWGMQQPAQAQVGANGQMTGPMAQPQQQQAAGAPASPYNFGNFNPWGSYDQMPWAQPGWPTGNNETAQGMQWLNTALPWLQAQQQGGQWQQSFEQRQAMDDWTRQYQQQQFGEQQRTNQWSEGFQTRALQLQRKEGAREREAAQERINTEAFGRRWKPNVRFF